MYIYTYRVCIYMFDGRVNGDIFVVDVNELWRNSTIVTIDDVALKNYR